MTQRTDFTADEWETLLAAPAMAGVLVVQADHNVLGLPREISAFGRAIADVDPAGDARGFVQLIVDDLKARRAEDDGDRILEGDTYDEMLRQVGMAAHIVDFRCERAVAVGYKEWVVSIARATAEASKEGSFFGFGGQRVTDKEQAALLEIQRTLNL